MTLFNSEELALLRDLVKAVEKIANNQEKMHGNLRDIAKYVKNLDEKGIVVYEQ
jgi:hypothetical protein